jgi:hypothetical protein
MAVLYITEFAAPAVITGQGAPVGAQPPLVEQTVAIGGTSTQSSAFNTATRFVRVHTDAICSISFGSSPTATATKARMAAGQTEYYAVKGGDKVAVITNT